MSSYRLLMLGKTGNGKSATGNTILRRTEFTSEIGSDSVTKENKASKTIDPQGREITVVDTIGLCDTNLPMTKVALKVQQSLSLASPGPHAFLIIMQPGRHTEEEKDTMDMLRIMFGPKLFQHAILVFTRGDNIPNPEVFFQRNLNNECMRKLMNKCRGGYIVINNNQQDKTNMEYNLKNLMEKVQSISNEGETYYHDDISILQDPLKKYADQWSASRWDSEQIKTLIQEQGEARERIHLERIRICEEEKAMRERENERLVLKHALELKEAESKGYKEGKDCQPKSNVAAEVGLTLLQGAVDIVVAGAGQAINRACSSRRTGSEILQNVGQRRQHESNARRTESEILQNVGQRNEHHSFSSHNSRTLNAFDRHFYRSGNHLWYTGDNKNAFFDLGHFPFSDKK